MKPVLATRDTRKVALQIVRALQSEKRHKRILGESYNDNARRWVLLDELEYVLKRVK